MKKTVVAVIAMVLTIGSKCESPNGGDPNRPQRAPNANGHRNDQPQGDPHPAEGDPNPTRDETRPVFFTVSFDGDRQMTVMVTIDKHTTTYYAKATGATTAQTWPGVARVGSVVSIKATPTLDAKRRGSNIVWIKTEDETPVCFSPIVEIGSAECAGAVPPKKGR